MSKHFRSPLFDTLRGHSPFQQLHAHADIVSRGVAELSKCVNAFIAGNSEEVAKLATSVSAIELEADHLKSNIRNHLPSNVRMPVAKPLFLDTLHEQDDMLDAAEDAAQWMAMRDSSVPEEVAKGLTTLLDAVVDTVNAYQAVVENLDDLVETGFVKRERDEEKELIQIVHEKEHVTDVLSRALSSVLLSREVENDVGPLSCYHQLKLTLQISNIADHAENAADRIRAMLAK